jgi:glycosyltransferase involved in cell wall biosynthesis
MRRSPPSRRSTTAPTLADYAATHERREREQPESCTVVVSIVTVALNSAATIERTIESVQTQSYAATEHIFVDGGSSDGTVDIIRRWIRPQDYCITEQDSGISDAFNKGVAMARGSVIQILNADDWLSPDQIARGVAALEETKVDFVFGDLIFYENGRPSFTYVGEADYARTIHRRLPTISHPTVLALRTCFERIGLFDPAFRRAMDYDWLLRLHRAGARGQYCPGIVGHMTHAGVSNREFRDTIEEVRAIAIAHGRNRLLASTEARLRWLKTATAGPIKRHLEPLYRLIRRRINPSYRPLPIHR